MFLYKYLQEFKHRLLLLLFTWLFTFIACYFYREALLFLIIEPQFQNLFTSYFIFTNVTEVFSIYIQLVYFFSIQIFFMYLIYHLFIFSSPALYYFEYYYLNFLIFLFVSTWYFFIILFVYLLVPASVNFFLSFESSNAYFEARINEYIVFYLSLYYLCFFYFQFFVVFFYFSAKDISIYNAKKFRKFYYYYFLMLSIIISPPDSFSQFIAFCIAVAIYEFLIISFIVKFYRLKIIRK